MGCVRGRGKFHTGEWRCSPPLWGLQGRRSDDERKGDRRRAPPRWRLAAVAAHRAVCVAGVVGG